MNRLFFFFTLLLFSLQATAQDNIVPHGIPEGIDSISYPEVSNYRSQIGFPPLIGWTLDGKKMLFNGGKVLYSMKSHRSEIKEYKTANQSFANQLSPNHDYFLFQEDEDGDEDYVLYLYSLEAQNSHPLSKKGDKCYDPFWCPDNEHIAYKSNKRNPAEVDLYISNIAGLTNERLLFQDFSDDGMVYDWSVEKHLMLAVKVISENDKSLYLINDQTGNVEQINAGKSGIAYSAARFIPNQNACLIVSDEFSEFLQLHLYDLDTKVFRTLTSAIPWDVENLTLDHAGNKAAFTVNEDGVSRLYTLDLKTWNYELVADLPAGVLGQPHMAPDGSKVGANLYSSTFNRKVFCYDLASKTLQQYARKGKLPTDTQAFVAAEPFTFNSIDPDTKEEYDIPAFIYRSGQPNSPVMIDIHGGPEYQIRAMFNGFYQYLVKELGITVIVPNVRGSNGYGKSYMKLDDGFLRENALEDVGALLDWVTAQPDLAEDRVAIFGESYGGFVSLASLARYPDRLACGIDVVGIANWITYLNNTSDYRRDLRRVEFGDERDPKMAEFLQRISPTSNIDRITSPLLIFQGLNDPRVDYRESEQVYQGLSSKGKEVWYVLAKNEGHGFHHWENYLLQRKLTISFLKKHLDIP